jgi:O-acetyl-ADP-ribose deacetylase (regulator of RNase III)
LLAGVDDPIEAVTQRAREVVLGALDLGWSGPPFDPLALTALIGVPVFPRADIRDARTVPHGEGALCIEYNPTRSRGRVRYSVAHEIAHTLFPDCAERIRNRSAYHELQGDEWQLEVLCNIAAAEFLMPIGSIPPEAIVKLSIDKALEMRGQFDVSTEAILIRLAHVTERPCTAFAASMIEGGNREGRYRVDYAIPSRSSSVRLSTGSLFLEKTVVRECAAIGVTAKSDESLPSGEKVHLECVGIPPYPGCSYPRVAGLMMGDPDAQKSPKLTYLKGSALEPRGEEQKIIVHVVNDATPNWGGRGFVAGLKERWPQAQQEFRDWATEARDHLKLGSVHLSRVSRDIYVASMVCQKGYGPSTKPRIRYAALEACLIKVADAAQKLGAMVHMPRIATGLAGGSWFIVEELISSTLCGVGVSAVVYDLPAGAPTRGRQMALNPQIT